MAEEITVHAEVDAIGLACPLPILRAKKALATMKSSEVLRVLATDAGSVKDFAAFALQTGNQLLGSRECEAGVFEFLLKRR
ncbi:MAG TPA: sulfurtransferase TusA family protein [Rhodocyclaceae bacterium]|jgi:tRNA 2-thiouridine synthesizing protein A|nr:sulfurtransferase TusA family protein [Rhodocyclaceae bacterium]